MTHNVDTPTKTPGAEQRGTVAPIAFHPTAGVFPLMGGADLDALTQDIREHGLREPIVLHPDGSILDGRNRYRTCLAADVVPRFVTWDGKGSAIAFVVSLNLHRRHLDESQRAMVGAKIANMEQGARTDLSPIGEKTSQGEAASTVNVSKRSVERARTVLDHGRSELIDAVEQSQIPVSTAAHVARLPPQEQLRIIARVASGQKPTEAVRSEHAATKHAAGAFPDGRYRVVLADPPFQYGTRMPPGSSEPTDYYPTMPLADICALPVETMVENNAVLFLWVPSPMLPEGLEVMAAWGFDYKALFVWDKVKHNVGHYNSVRHELLLVCVRGSCQPDVRKLHDSVVVEERTAHSAKPETFRTIIDTIYTHGKRIELFRRGPAVAGWDAWGNEAGRLCPAG